MGAEVSCLSGWFVLKSMPSNTEPHILGYPQTDEYQIEILCGTCSDSFIAFGLLVLGG